MLELLVRVLLAAVLAGAALAKLSRPRRSSAALAVLGFEGEGSRWAAWGIAIGAELALAGLIVAGSDSAAFAAAALMLVYAGVMGGAVMRGRAGAECGCFGARSKVGAGAMLRNLGLAAAFAAVPFVPDADVSTEGWLAIGLGLALASSAVLGVLLFALAREVGLMRLRLGPSSALEIAHEGPELGGRSIALIDRFDLPHRADLAIAVFTSPGCRICHELEPAIEALSGEPTLALATFDEQGDSELWESLAVPGAPYAVALDRDGTVLAKGTFNNLAQLESVAAMAERRRTGGETEEASVV